MMSQYKTTQKVNTRVWVRMYSVVYPGKYRRKYAYLFV